MKVGMNTIYYATGNQGKFEEVKEYLERNEPTLELKQYKCDLQEQQSSNQLAIALDKAQQAWQALKRPVLVDDSGIYFEKYHKFPGTMTKFLYYGVGMEGICKLIKQGDKATFLLQLIFQDGDQSYKIFEGKCEGHLVIPDTFQAHPELPYDDIFQPDGAESTYAHMRGTAELDEYAYRLRALKKFISWYKTKTVGKP